MGSVLVRSKPSNELAGVAPFAFDSTGILASGDAPEGILDGLVGAWELDESGTGPAFDYSDYARHASNWNFASSDAGLITNSRVTDRNAEAHFVINSAPHYAVGMQAFCGMIWAKPAIKDRNHGVFTKSSGGLHHYGWGIYYFTTQDRYGFRAVYNLNANDRPTDQTVTLLANEFGPPPLNEWHLIYFQRDPSDGTHGSIGIAIDDGPLETKPFFNSAFHATNGPAFYGGIPHVDVPIRIGHWSPQEWPILGYFHGQLYGARLWIGRLLNSGERSYLYNNGNGRTFSAMGGRDVPLTSIPDITNLTEGQELWILGDGNEQELGYVFAGGNPTPTYEIVGGTDADKFSVNSVTGQLSFIDPPEYATPLDADGNNRYEFQLAASNSEGSHILNLKAVVGNGDPELPREYVNTDLPTGWDGAPDDSPANATALRTTSMSNINQNAGNPHIIELQAGVDYSMSDITLPNKTGSEWVIIRTSNYEDLPEYGAARVSPADAPNMAKLTFTAVNTGGVKFSDGAHKIRFIGIEITTSVVNSSGLVQLDKSNEDITFDRCYIHGTTTLNTRRAIRMHGRRIAVVQCHIDEIHEIGNGDTQAIASWDGRGPYKIVENYLSSAGEVFISGGATCSSYEEIPADFEIRRNYFYKPETWYRYHEDFAGIEWGVKNIFECKNSKRMLVEGNIFSGNWAQGQAGMSILFSVRNTSGQEWWSTSEDMTFIYNKIERIARGISITTRDGDPGKSMITSRFNIAHNLVEITPEFSRGTMDMMAWYGGFRSIFLKINHNTFISLGGVGAQSVFAGLDTGAAFTPPAKFCDEFELKDNIFFNGTYGVHFGLGSSVAARFDLCFDDYIVTNNLRILHGATAGVWPAGNPTVPTIADVGFVDHANGDYRLNPSSAYAAGNVNDASDNTDLGCDVATLNTKIAGVKP